MNTGDAIWRGHFYAGRCTLNGFIMTAYAPRLYRFSVSSLFRSLSSSHSLFPSSNHPGDFGRNNNGDTAGPRVFLFLPFAFFRNFQVNRPSLWWKYVSYLSDVSPARSSHANRTEDSPLPTYFSSLSSSHLRVRASMQNALISSTVYRPTGWKYYLGSVHLVEREDRSLSRAHLLPTRAGKYRAPLV